MSNYVTVDNRNQNPNTDLAYIMPMVAGEVAQRRKRADAVAASMNVLEQQALADPEKFKNATFNVSDNGLIGMNQSAKDLYAVNPEFDMKQVGFSNSTEELNTEGNQQLLDVYDKDKAAKENSDIAKIANAIARGDTDMYKLQLAGQQGYANRNGSDLGTQLTQIEQNKQSNTNVSKEPEIPPTETSEANNAKSIDPNFVGVTDSIKSGDVLAGMGQYKTPEIPLAAPSQTVKNNGKPTPLQEAKEVTKELAKENPTKSVSAKSGKNNTESKSEGKSESSHFNYSRDVEGATSKLTYEQGKKSMSSQRSNIIDTDKSSIPQLRRNAGLEAATNAFSMVNNGIPISQEMHNRLADRQAFIDKHMAGYGVTQNISKIDSGKITYDNTGGKAKESSQVGASSQTNVSSSFKVGDVGSASVRMPGNKNDNDSKFNFSGSFGDGQFTKNGNTYSNSTGKLAFPKVNEQSYNNPMIQNYLKGKGVEKDGYVYYPTDMQGVQIRTKKGSNIPENWVFQPGASINTDLAPVFIAGGTGQIQSDRNISAKRQYAQKPNDGKNYRAIIGPDGKTYYEEA